MISVVEIWGGWVVGNKYTLELDCEIVPVVGDEVHIWQTGQHWRVEARAHHFNTEQRRQVLRLYCKELK